jgi:hypothetical protein
VGAVRPAAAHTAPAGHGAHWVAFARPVALEAVPTGQGVSLPSTLPPAQKKPAGHGAATLVPALAQALPGGHGRQVACAEFGW